jgi:glycosyltransferase involved in cell wall biosynthesis
MKLKPDIIHVMYGGIMAYLVTNGIRDLPIVVSFCGSDLLGSPGHALRGWVGVQASYCAAERASGIVVKTKGLELAVPSHVDRAWVRVVPNGIDLERFKPMDRTRCCSQLRWRSSAFHVLFSASSNVVNKRPELAAEATEILKRAGVDAEIHWLRGVPHADVPVWVNASDCLILTSMHEGGVNVVKEALACNVPVVAVNVGDVSERLRGVEGCYIAEARADQLANRLARVHVGPRRINGRSTVQDLSIERVAERLRMFYGEVLARR